MVKRVEPACQEADTALIYVRQSKDKRKSTEDQLAECREAAAELGKRVVGERRDGTSASRFATKDRSEWADTIADLDAGLARTLFLWECSRADRDPESWFPFLAMCRRRGVLVHVVTHERTYDVSRRRDWRALADEGVESADESEKTSERTRRGTAAAAVEGRPHGRIPYGYERRYDPVTKEFVEQRPHPEQAPVVRAIYERVVAGDPLVQITRNLNDLGVPPPTPRRPWVAQTVKAIATSHTYIGKRLHHGQVHDGTWPALVEEDVWWTAHAILTDEKRKRFRPGRNRYLLSQAARCGVCGEFLQGRPRSDQYETRYSCSGRGCVAVRVDWLDEYVTDLVCAWLSREDVQPLLVVEDDAEARAAKVDAARLRDRLDEHYDEAAEGRLSAAGMARIEGKLLPHIREADERAAVASTPPALRGLVGGDVRGQWASLDVSARKDVVRHLMPELVVLPASSRSRWVTELDEARVRYRWRDLPAPSPDPAS